MIRNRIKGHRRVRAGDLVPHEMNPRTHTDTQRDALAALYQEVGFARSLLAYEIRCGRCYDWAPEAAPTCFDCRGARHRLKLIDGHLRQGMDADMEVDVEVLDVNDDEARKLLLSIDPLAQLAGFDQEAVEKLQATVRSDNDTLNGLWAAVANSQSATDAALKKSRGKRRPPAEGEEQFLLVIECENEHRQVELLRRFKREGLVCQAKTS